MSQIFKIGLKPTQKCQTQKFGSYGAVSPSKNDQIVKNYRRRKNHPRAKTKAVPKSVNKMEQLETM